MLHFIVMQMSKVNREKGYCLELVTSEASECDASASTAYPPVFTVYDIHYHSST